MTYAGIVMGAGRRGLRVPPLLQNAFHMAPLDPQAWLLLVCWPVLGVAAEEARKAVLRRRP